MNRPLLAACAVLCHLAGHAQELPARLAGAWNTEAQPSTDTGQAFIALYLQADGSGAIIGSQPAIRLDGAVDRKPAPRATIGFPVRATLDGAKLSLQPLLRPGQHDAAAPRARMSCDDDARTQTLRCAGLGQDSTMLHRHSATVPPEVTQMLQQLR